MRAGLGTTSDPGTFLVTGAFDVPLDETLGVGGMLQLGTTDERTIVAPSVHVFGTIPLRLQNEDRLSMSVNAGMGIAYLAKDDIPGSDSETGLLINFGGGLMYRLNESLALETAILINFLPGEVLDERNFVSFQLLNLVFKL